MFTYRRCNQRQHCRRDLPLVRPLRVRGCEVGHDAVPKAARFAEEDRAKRLREDREFERVVAVNRILLLNR